MNLVNLFGPLDRLFTATYYTIAVHLKSICSRVTRHAVRRLITKVLLESSSNNFRFLPTAGLNFSSPSFSSLHQNISLCLPLLLWNSRQSTRSPSLFIQRSLWIAYLNAHLEPQEEEFCHSTLSMKPRQRTSMGPFRPQLQQLSSYRDGTIHA